MHVYSWKFKLNFNSNHTQKLTKPPVKFPILWTNNKKFKKNKFEKSKTKHNYLKISLENLLELKTFTWHVKNKTVLVFLWIYTFGYFTLFPLCKVRHFILMATRRKLFFRNQGYHFNRVYHSRLPFVTRLPCSRMRISPKIYFAVRIFFCLYLCCFLILLNATFTGGLIIQRSMTLTPSG